MSTSAAIIAASHDPDILARAIALGASMGLTQADVEAARTRLASAPVGDGDSTIATVYEYAVTSRAPVPPRPGEDPTKITDAHLRHALSTLT